MEGGYFRKSSTTKWWDGYKGERNVLIDEFDGQSIGIAHLLQWCDWYPMQVEVKGGSANLLANKFFITSNIDPNEWWPEAKYAHKEAFKRRVTLIKHYSVPFVEIVEDVFLNLLNN